MAESPSALINIIELARKHWPSNYGLLLAEIFSISLSISILLALNPGIAASIITLAAFGGIAWLVWWRSNLLPRTKRGKVGFVISISTEDENEHKKIM
jgi:hypothetical protein